MDYAGLPAEAAHAMRSTAANVRTGRRYYDGRWPQNCVASTTDCRWPYAGMCPSD